MSAAALRLMVARRQVPRIPREAKTTDEFLGIVKEAVESDRALVARGEPRLDDKELLDLACEATEAERPALLMALARRRMANRLRAQSDRIIEADPDTEDVDAYLEGIIEDLREQGIL